LWIQQSPTRGDTTDETVHRTGCACSELAVISQAGKRLKDFPVETNGEALVEAVGMIPGCKHLVFEEDLQSAWLYERLSPHVDEVVVAGVTESRGQKDDRRDAYGMAEKLRRGILEKRIFKAPRQFSVLRELSRIHMTATHDLVRLQSRIKSLYRSRGILVPAGSVYSARHRQQWQERLPVSVQTRATRLYGHFDFLAEQKKQAECDLARVFSWQETRLVSKSLTLSYKRVLYVLDPTDAARAVRGKRVGIEEREDGSLSFWHGEHALLATAFPKDHGVPQGEVVENKRLSAALEFIKAQQRERIAAKLAKPSTTRRDARLLRAGTPRRPEAGASVGARP
jgi:hypothetical protein